MNGHVYPYGDVYPGGIPKTGDAANFGLFKNNCTALYIPPAASEINHT